MTELQSRSSATAARSASSCDGAPSAARSGCASGSQASSGTAARPHPTASTPTQRSSGQPATAALQASGGDGAVANLLRLTLPWPPAALNPNTRHAHWSQLARAKKRFRSACALTARAQGAGRLCASELAISLVFVPPNRRARDLDNCIAAMKSGLDGLADILGVDDSLWTLTARLDSSIGGFVRVEVSPWTA